MTPRPKSAPGKGTITRADPNHRCSGTHRPNSPVVAGPSRHRRWRRSRKFLFLNATETGTGSEAGNFCFWVLLKRVQGHRKHIDALAQFEAVRGIRAL